MPTIARFYGIVIYMYHGDHAPPHFHAVYNEFVASVDILTLEFTGDLPRKAKRLVMEWAELHRGELLLNWHRASKGIALQPIAPLE